MSHFYLQGFHDVDIVKSLQEIAEKNTDFLSMFWFLRMYFGNFNFIYKSIKYNFI